MASLFDILINIATNTASFDSGMQKVEQRLGNLGSLIEKGLGAAGIALSLGGITDEIGKAVDSGEQLSNLALRLGTTTEDLSQLQYAAATADVPFQALTSSIDIFEKGLSQAVDGTGRAKVALADLGIDAAKLAALPLDQQLDIIANKLAAIESPTERTALAMRLFGSAGAELVPILAQGSDGLDKLRQRSDELGATLGSSTAARLKDAKDAMTDMAAASKGLWNELVSDLAPAITAVEKALTAVISSGDKFKTAFGAQKAGTSDQDQMQAYKNEAQALADQIAKISATMGSTSFFGKLFQDKNDLANITKASAQLDALSQTISDLQAKIAGKGQGATADIGDELTEVLVRATKMNEDYMQQYYDKLQAMSKTDVERNADDWQQKEDAARQLYADGIIDATEFQSRIDALNDAFLQPVEVTAKSMGKLIKAVYDDMDNYAKSAAQSIQSEFATFLEDPSKNSFKAMGVAWLQTLDKMVADAADSDLFNALFKGANSKSSGLEGLFGSILGSVFGGGAGGGSIAGTAGSAADLGNYFSALQGFAGGGSFDTGGSGGTDSQLVAFKATPGEHVQIGGNSGGDIYQTINVSVTSPQVTKADVISAAKQASDSAVSRIKDEKRRGKF